VKLFGSVDRRQRNFAGVDSAYIPSDLVQKSTLQPPVFVEVLL
jgi:hypothetical protein